MKLLVIIPDSLSSLIQKGEITDRYYNPGNLFDEVHILTCNDDKPDSHELQKTVGTARLFLHNLPEEERFLIHNTRWFKPWLLEPWAKPFLYLVKEYQFKLLNDWAQPGIELAREIKPDLIRCHGNDTNAYLAGRIKLELGIPYVVSLHTNPDVDPRRRPLPPYGSWWEQLYSTIFDAIEIQGLIHADRVLPVYQSIIPYLERAGCSNYEIAYNVLPGENLIRKEDYALHHPVRVISVGRHYVHKNPENIIRAVGDLPNVHLTLVGDGPYQERLQALVSECGLEDRVVIIPAIPNSKLCSMLHEYDVFAVHVEAFGISKTVLEALLVGMPVITNLREGIGGQVPELDGDFVMRVNDTSDGYARAIRKLVEDDALRESQGRKAYARAQENWASAKTEMKYVEIYKQVMSSVRKKRP